MIKKSIFLSGENFHLWFKSTPSLLVIAIDIAHVFYRGEVGRFRWSKHWWWLLVLTIDLLGWFRWYFFYCLRSYQRKLLTYNQIAVCRFCRDDHIILCWRNSPLGYRLGWSRFLSIPWHTTRMRSLKPITNSLSFYKAFQFFL